MAYNSEAAEAATQNVSQPEGGDVSSALTLQAGMHSQLANAAQTLVGLHQASEPTIDLLADQMVAVMDVDSRLMQRFTEKMTTRSALGAFQPDANAFDVTELLPDVSIQRDRGAVHIALGLKPVSNPLAISGGCDE